MDLNSLQKIKLDRDPYQIAEFHAHDEFGDYLTGTFLYGKTIVIVSHEEDRWHLSIKSKNPLGIHQITELRYLFIPDKVKMAYRLPSRDRRSYDPTKVSLWETFE